MCHSGENPTQVYGPVAVRWAEESSYSKRCQNPRTDLTGRIQTSDRTSCGPHRWKKTPLSSWWTNEARVKRPWAFLETKLLISVTCWQSAESECSPPELLRPLTPERQQRSLIRKAFQPLTGGALSLIEFINENCWLLLCLEISEPTDLMSVFLLPQENHHRPPFFGIFSFIMFSTEAWRQPCLNSTQNWLKM